MRVSEISITKAIGIILMVLGHSGCPKLMSDAIYQFHMPLFFIMSGMCLKEEHIHNIPNFIKRKVVGIWWPYVKYGSIFLLLHNLLFNLNIYNSEYGYLDRGTRLYALSDYLRNFLKVIRMTGAEELLGGFWFLHALFWGSIISVVILGLFKRKYLALGFTIIFTVLMSAFKIDIPVVHVNSTTLLSASFFMIGYCCKSITVTNWIYPIAIIFMIAGLTWGEGSMHVTQTILVIPYVIVATLCSLAVHKFSSSIIVNSSLRNVVVSLGDRTLPILVWHFISFKVVSLLIIYIYELPIEYLAKFPVIEEYSIRGWWLLYVFAGIVIPILINTLRGPILRITDFQAKLLKLTKAEN